MNPLIKQIRPVPRVNARIRLPGSKSITHRALIMAALAAGPSEIGNPLKSEDTMLTARALEQLGAGMNWGADSVRVSPPRTRWREPEETIFLGNSGTSARLLIAVVAAGCGRFALDGTPRLRERPIGAAAYALASLGAEVRWLGEPGFLPVEITASGLAGRRVRVDAGKSSQFLSGILIAAPTARSDVRIEWSEPAASFPYVLITLEMMNKAGIRFERTGANSIFLPAPQVYAPRGVVVEGDFSSASYFWGAAALTGGAVFTYPLSEDSPQGDRRLLDVLGRMGCRIAWERDGVRVEGPDVLSPVDVDMNMMPDMVPTLAVLAGFAQGTSRIRNVAHLRIKESDRLESVASGLGVLGIPVERLEDGLVIRGGSAMAPSSPICAFDDHRIAMAFALAGLRLRGVAIEGAESVAKSFPDFWEIFDRLEG
ncbi:MAG: 3-phosphoshikimate 1-carboxyvinyltransferase [Desulfobacteraceae bacterium]|nr:3-phosphoshikimate 1-carboxyvinyltransferase [Desulfobacteraceae bacterium]